MTRDAGGRIPLGELCKVAGCGRRRLGSSDLCAEHLNERLRLERDSRERARGSAGNWAAWAAPAPTLAEVAGTSEPAAADGARAAAADELATVRADVKRRLDAEVARIPWPALLGALGPAQLLRRFERAIGELDPPRELETWRAVAAVLDARKGEGAIGAEAFARLDAAVREPAKILAEVLRGAAARAGERRPADSGAAPSVPNFGASAESTTRTEASSTTEATNASTDIPAFTNPTNSTRETDSSSGSQHPADTSGAPSSATPADPGLEDFAAEVEAPAAAEAEGATRSAEAREGATGGARARETAGEARPPDLAAIVRELAEALGGPRLASVVDPAKVARALEPERIAALLEDARRGVLDRERLEKLIGRARADALLGGTAGGLLDPVRLARLLDPERIARSLDPESIARALDPERLARLLDPERMAKAASEAAAKVGAAARDVLEPSLVRWLTGGVVDPASLRRGADALKAAARSVTGRSETDAYGRDADAVALARPLLRLLYRRWWRVEASGLERLPARGPALVVANRSGALPWDAAMIATAAREDAPRPREVRPVALDWLADVPVATDLLQRLGLVVARPENVERLLAEEEIVLVFPEGGSAVAKPRAERYRVAPLARGDLVAIARRVGAPVVPCAVVGAAEAEPVHLRLDAIGRLFGLDGPLAAPLLPVPLPTRWRIRFGAPAPAPAAPDDAAEDVRAALQALVDALVAERRSVFW